MTRTNNPIARFILSAERQGRGEPVDYSHAEDYFGGTRNMHILAGLAFAEMAFSLAQGGNVPKFSLRSNLKGLKNQSIQNKDWMDSKTVLGNDAITLRNSQRLKSEEGVHTVLIHGTPEGFILNGKPITPKILAQKLLDDGFVKGTTVRLVSCHTGVYADGAAYELSRYLKSPVIAPTNKVRVTDDGKYVIDGNGRFRLFFNGNVD